ncbi:hypothetical protein [Clavibacter michiganensis]|uniref:hypothetical protein n=1 Tax=Clavibacter michiganensis TaxID=28447 RepID=UPI00168154AD|nr:hypothetical protein [Clavibacter michiganensis]
MTQEQQDDAAFQELFSRYEDLDPNRMTNDILESLLTDKALADEQKELSNSSTDVMTYEGVAHVSNFLVTSRGKDDAENDYMVGQACLDVSQTRVLDTNGNQVNADRPPTISMQIKALKISDGSWRIGEVVRNDSVAACS